MAPMVMLAGSSHSTQWRSSCVDTTTPPALASQRAGERKGTRAHGVERQPSELDQAFLAHPVAQRRGASRGDARCGIALGVEALQREPLLPRENLAVYAFVHRRSQNGRRACALCGAPHNAHYLERCFMWSSDRQPQARCGVARSLAPHKNCRSNMRWRAYTATWSPHRPCRPAPSARRGRALSCARGMPIAASAIAAQGDT